MGQSMKFGSIPINRDGTNGKKQFKPPLIFFKIDFKPLQPTFIRKKQKQGLKSAKIQTSKYGTFKNF